MKNWRTTLTGALTGLIIIGTQVLNLLDNDPATVFSFELLMAGIAAMGIGWFAKDAGE